MICNFHIYFSIGILSTQSLNYTFLDRTLYIFRDNVFKGRDGHIVSGFLCNLYHNRKARAFNSLFYRNMKQTIYHTCIILYDKSFCIDIHTLALLSISQCCMTSSRNLCMLAYYRSTRYSLRGSFLLFKIEYSFKFILAR